MSRRFAPAAAAAALLLAACGGPGPAITDPREIMIQGLEATAQLGSVHLELDVEGSVSVPELGGGDLSLSGTRLAGDLDIENANGHFTFTVPALLGLNGEMIQIGDVSYVKTSMTGPQWVKSTVTEDDPVAAAMDPIQALDQVRSFLDEEGVELQKLDDVECGDGTCYAVRLTVPSELMAGAGEAVDALPPDAFGEALVLDLLFDREELWLTEASTSLGSESVGDLALTLSLSEFNEEIDVSAPPEDEVTEGGGQLFPF